MNKHKDVRRGPRLAAASVAIGAAVALVLSGCSGNSGASGSSITLALQGQIQSFDPWGAPNGYNGSLWATGSVYDSLTHLDSNAKPVPWLATSWTTPDPLHYTLKLRNDVKFTDGSKFNADAVVANLKYAQESKQPGECNVYLTGITAEADGDSAVKLTLKDANPDLLTDFGTCAGFMVSPKALGDPTALQKTPVGSGPYVLDKSTSIQGQSWVLKRNPDYWNKSAYPFDKVTLKFFQDATAAANAAKTGQVDLIQSIDPKTDTSGLAHLLSAPQEFRGLYFTDVTGKLVPALGDVRVRQAMNYAIDRDTILKQVYGETAAVSYSTPFPEGTDGFTSALAKGYPYDPAKAKQLLAEAGYSSGLTIKTMNFPALAGTLTQVISGYLRAVGITLQISDQPNDFVTQMQSGTWPLLTGNFTLSSSQYHNLVGLTGPEGFFNPLHNVDKESNDLLDQIAATTDKSKQKSLYEQLATHIQQESWFLAPVLVKSASAYNDKKLKVTVTPGSAVPFIYNIQKK